MGARRTFVIREGYVLQTPGSANRLTTASLLGRIAGVSFKSCDGYTGGIVCASAPTSTGT